MSGTVDRLSTQSDPARFSAAVRHALADVSKVIEFEHKSQLRKLQSDNVELHKSNHYLRSQLAEIARHYNENGDDVLLHMSPLRLLSRDLPTRLSNQCSNSARNMLSPSSVSCAPVTLAPMALSPKEMSRPRIGRKPRTPRSSEAARTSSESASPLKSSASFVADVERIPRDLAMEAAVDLAVDMANSVSFQPGGSTSMGLRVTRRSGFDPQASYSGVSQFLDSSGVDGLMSRFSASNDAITNRAIEGWRCLFQGLGFGTMMRLDMRQEYVDFAANSPGTLLHSRSYARVTKSNIKKKSMLAKLEKGFTHMSTWRLGTNEISHIIIHPGSYLWITWTCACALLLVYDLITVPTSFCTETLESSVSNVMLWIARCFWSADIIVSCITGLSIHNFRKTSVVISAWTYAKTWLVFDLTLVVLDWLFWFLESKTVFYYVVASVRLVRFLRLIRVRDWLVDALQRRHPGIWIYVDFIRIVLLCMAWVHIGASGWYCIGEANGSSWSHDLSSTYRLKYLTSAHLVFSQVHGTSNIELRTIGERIFALLSLSIGLLLFSLFVAKVTHMVFYISQKEAGKLQPTWQRFKKDHTMQLPLIRRAERYLAVHNKRVKFEDRMFQASELMVALPARLRADILEDARKPRLTSIRFFSDLGYAFPKAVRQICSEMNEFFCLEREVVFCKGDECNRVLFVESGELTYHWSREKSRDVFLFGRADRSTSSTDFKIKDRHNRMAILRDRLRQMTKSVSLPAHRSQTNKDFMTTSSAMMQELFLMQAGEHSGAQRVRAGRHMSEAVLWTEWIHQGDLVSHSDSVLLSLPVEAFLYTCRGGLTPYVMEMAVVYCNRFVTRLKAVAFHSDLFEFAENLLGEDEDDNSDERIKRKLHYIFLSHYKSEAGTEATLMQEQLHRLVQREGLHPAKSMKTPIFLDSENLTALNSLRTHVVQTMYMLLLLTPGVLKRPWCLVEVVMALRNGVKVVPVEIQRPGMEAFSFPTEAFYFELRSGTILDAAAQQLLANEKILLGDVEEALRKVFQQIALPFSPHKSQNIRQAELENVLKRCPYQPSVKSTASLKSSKESLSIRPMAYGSEK